MLIVIMIVMITVIIIMIIMIAVIIKMMIRVIISVSLNSNKNLRRILIRRFSCVNLRLFSCWDILGLLL